MTAPTTPNAELAYRVLDQIDANPSLHSQAWWFTVTDCGTAACFAGWACLVAGDKPHAFDRPLQLVAVGEDISFAQGPDGEVVYASDRAAELLGVDKTTARTLFDGHNTREDLGRLVAEIFGPRRHPAESSFAPAATLKDSPDPMFPEGEPVDEQAWRECAHRADYTSAAHHERGCAYHRGEVDEWGQPVDDAAQQRADYASDHAFDHVDHTHDDVPPNAGSQS
jgi:hypothetical protein